MVAWFIPLTHVTDLYRGFVTGELEWSLVGDVAWLVVACNMKDTTPEGQPREYALNVSAVLKTETAGWKFQTMHFSNLTGSDAPPPATAPAPGMDAATPVQPK